MIKVLISSFCFVAAFRKMNISYMLQCTKFSLTFRPQNHTLYPWTACECISYRAVARLQNKTRQVSGLAEMLFEAFSVAFVLRKVSLFMAMEIQVVVLNVTLLSSIFRSSFIRKLAVMKNEFFPFKFLQKPKLVRKLHFVIFAFGLAKLSFTVNPIICTSRNRHFLVAFIELSFL